MRLIAFNANHTIRAEIEEDVLTDMKTGKQDPAYNLVITPMSDSAGIEDQDYVYESLVDAKSHTKEEFDIQEWKEVFPNTIGSITLTQYTQGMGAITVSKSQVEGGVFPAKAIIMKYDEDGLYVAELILFNGNQFQLGRGYDLEKMKNDLLEKYQLKFN